MRETVYIETTIPSYYASKRTGMEFDIARTRQWWDADLAKYDAYISPVVIDELIEGDYPTKQECLDLVRSLPVLAINGEVIAVAETYVASKVMPGPPVRDALHVAFACFYRMDYLLTWNCVHIANANKTKHLRVVNTPLGLNTPQIITPHMLRAPETHE
ncbi:MAG: type II toxin-antitoxin system VapC family toxin [Phycisphaerales bacterium]|nr:type II toxin-antitoxin system VapC family toxin [Phycisphaerales bacterium]